MDRIISRTPVLILVKPGYTDALLPLRKNGTGVFPNFHISKGKIDAPISSQVLRDLSILFSVLYVGAAGAQTADLRNCETNFIDFSEFTACTGIFFTREETHEFLDLKGNWYTAEGTHRLLKHSCAVFHRFEQSGNQLILNSPYFHVLLTQIIAQCSETELEKKNWYIPFADVKTCAQLDPDISLSCMQKMIHSGCFSH